MNGVAPEQATSRSFARALGRAVHRPARLPLPALALKAIFGEAATVLLASQRVQPRALERLQLEFDYPTLDGALEDIVGGAAVTISPAQSRPREPGGSLRTAGQHGDSCADRGDVRLLLEGRESRPDHAGRDEVPHPGAGALDGAGRGDRLSRAHRSTVDSLAHSHHQVGTGRSFVDLQEAGPYSLWWHEHTFQADGERTIMADRVYYAPPLGILGRLANRLFIVPTLRKIFQYRGDVIRLRFGPASIKTT